MKMMSIVTGVCTLEMVVLTIEEESGRMKEGEAKYRR